MYSILDKVFLAPNKTSSSCPSASIFNNFTFSYVYESNSLVSISIEISELNASKDESPVSLLIKNFLLLFSLLKPIQCRSAFLNLFKFNLRQLKVLGSGSNAL